MTIGHLASGMKKKKKLSSSYIAVVWAIVKIWNGKVITAFPTRTEAKKYRDRTYGPWSANFKVVRCEGYYENSR